jgi:hypothetical protein
VTRLARNVRGKLLPAIVAAFSLAPSVLVAQGVQHADEYRVKAAVLYNLAKFVEWPPDAFADAETSFTICILGGDPFGPVLDEVLKGRQLVKRAVIVKRIADMTPGCHLLFVASSEWKRVPVIIDRLGSASALTVSEDEGFTDRGGMVGLTLDGEQVKFIINGKAAERARLRISARLMALASGPRRSAGAPR